MENKMCETSHMINTEDESSIMTYFTNANIDWITTQPMQHNLQEINQEEMNVTINTGDKSSDVNGIINAGNIY